METDPSAFRLSVFRLYRSIIDPDAGRHKNAFGRRRSRSVHPDNPIRADYHRTRGFYRTFTSSESLGDSISKGELSGRFELSV